MVFISTKQLMEVKKCEKKKRNGKKKKRKNGKKKNGRDFDQDISEVFL